MNFGDSLWPSGVQGGFQNTINLFNSRRKQELCFFPQNFVSQITTPIFFANSEIDSWQIKHILAPNAADWHDCKPDIKKCTPVYSGSYLHM
ncbi:hypothetical protein TSUD_200260 [Trifolium subterraneum]|nr:hypothetical protein TSUD_200260 [Trifolium subterraneum]